MSTHAWWRIPRQMMRFVLKIWAWQIGGGSSSWRFALLKLCATFVTNKREMWKLYQTSKATYSRPSRLMCVKDRLTAYQFDAAVTLFGIIAENALSELMEVGSGKNKRHAPRYTLTDILDNKFQLPPSGQMGSEKLLGEDT